MANMKLHLCLLVLTVGVMAFYSAQAFRMVIYRQPNHHGANRTYSSAGRYKTPWTPDSYRWIKSSSERYCMKTCNDKHRVGVYCEPKVDAHVGRNETFNWVLIYRTNMEIYCRDNSGGGSGVSGPAGGNGTDTDGGSDSDSP